MGVGASRQEEGFPRGLSQLSWGLSEHSQVCLGLSHPCPFPTHLLPIREGSMLALGAPKLRASETSFLYKFPNISI